MATIVSTIPAHSFENSTYFNYFGKLETKFNYSTPSFGLVPKDSYTVNHFKLLEFNIESNVQDTITDSTFHLKYTNGSVTPVEGKYVLPLPPTSTVYDMKIEYDGKVLVGKIKEKTKAQNTYSDAIASGGQGFLAERTAEGYFELLMGNVPPGKDVDVKVKVIGELGSHLETLHYFLHKFYFPKYDFNFNLKLNIRISGGIEDITLLNSPTQPKITYDTVNGKKVFANVEHSSTNQQQSNVILVVKPLSTEKPLPVVEYNSEAKSYATAINFNPSFTDIDPMDVDQKSEFIFLVDCSGSMSGEPIKKAKSALEICVRGLSESHKFNIYCFGSSFKKMFPQSKLYNDATLLEASNYIGNIGADLGGTELLDPIKDILSSKYDQEYPKQVFIFTDGEVDNRDGLIDYVSKESYVRIFTYGIGTSVDRALIMGLSKACKGYYEFIDNVREMESRVMKLFAIAMEPTISNIKIDWSELPFTTTPSIIRPIFSGERLTIYGITETPVKKEFKDTTITLTGTSPKGELLKFKIPLEFSNSIKDSKSIHTLAAYSIIRDLCEEEAKLGKVVNEERVVKLGKQFGIVSKHTSYVVTNESKEKTTDTMQTVQLNANKTDTKVPSESVGPSRVRSSPQTSSKLSYNSISTTLDCISDDLMSSSVQGEMFNDEDECDSYLECKELEEQLCEPMELKKQVRSSSPTKTSLIGSVTSFFKKSISSPQPVQSMPQPVQSMPQPVQSIPSLQSIQPSNVPILMPTPSPSASYSRQYSSSSSHGDSYPSSKPATTILLSIISSQNANGSFNESSLPFKITAPVPDVIKDLLAVWITIFVLERLKKDHHKDQDQWNLTAQKAMKFIRSALQKAGKFDELQNLQTIAAK